MIKSTFFKDEENELSSVSDEMFYMFFFFCLKNCERRVRALFRVFCNYNIVSIKTKTNKCFGYR